MSRPLSLPVIPGLARFFLASVTTLALATGVAGVTTACGEQQDTKTAKVVSGPIPDGETWTGVYFHPVYGYLHLIEEGSNVVGRWKRADQSKWGELSGTQKGNVMHYAWKEHTIGLVGASATTHGKGYFQYKKDAEDRPILDGQFGLNDNEVGSDWHNVKQARMTPDLKSIGGDSEGIKPGGF
jgi:hypothetical protein